MLLALSTAVWIGYMAYGQRLFPGAQAAAASAQERVVRSEPLPIAPKS